MRIDDLGRGARAAGTTFALTFALCGIGFLDADSPPPIPLPLIDAPALAIDGGSITVATDHAVYAVDAAPSLTLRATNWTDRPLTSELTIELMSMAPASSMSRVLALPEVRWTQLCSITVPPHTSVARAIVADAALTTDEQHTFVVTADGTSWVAMDLQVEGGIDPEEIFLSLEPPLIDPRAALFATFVSDRPVDLALIGVDA